MTPAERLVIETSLRLVANDERWSRPAGALGSMRELAQAVEALRAERGQGTTTDELELTWGQVVEGDQIYSPRSSKWYPVESANHSPASEGRSTIVATGPGMFRKASTSTVKVRRGATGDAVDIIASVLWSAPASREVTPS